LGPIGEIAALYGRIGRACWSWAPTLLLLALVVFVPLGLIGTVSVEMEIDSLDFGNGAKIAALLAAIGALTATSLVGEVFYSGAIAVSLTHPGQERPSLAHIARHLDYRRLIVVDLVYVALVVVGLALLVVPGVLAFVWLGLSGPVMELERPTVRGALVRSWQLVRGRFWLVFGVLVPIELAGEAAGEAIAEWIHDLLGPDFLATWFAEVAGNVLFAPIFAVAAVVLTVQLIAEKDGDGPRLNPRATGADRPTPVSA